MGGKLVQQAVGVQALEKAQRDANEQVRLAASGTYIMAFGGMLILLSGLTLQGRRHLADIHKRMAPSMSHADDRPMEDDIVMDSAGGTGLDDDEWVDEADEDGTFALRDIMDLT